MRSVLHGRPNPPAQADKDQEEQAGYDQCEGAAFGRNRHEDLVVHRVVSQRPRIAGGWDYQRNIILELIDASYLEVREDIEEGTSRKVRCHHVCLRVVNDIQNRVGGVDCLHHVADTIVDSHGVHTGGVGSHD